MRVHHIGYLVKNMEKARASFAELNFVLESGPTRDDIRKINICFMKNEATRVELIEMAGEGSVVSGLVKKLGITPYHICYTVPSIEKAIQELEQKKYIMTAPPEIAPALENRKVAFFYNRNIGLIEVLEEK